MRFYAKADRQHWCSYTKNALKWRHKGACCDVTVADMKETHRRRITVTSSLNQISTDQLGNGGGGLRPTPSEQIFKDVVNGFSSPSYICFMVSHTDYYLESLRPRFSQETRIVEGLYCKYFVVKISQRDVFNGCFPSISSSQKTEAKQDKIYKKLSGALPRSNGSFYLYISGSFSEGISSVRVIYQLGNPTLFFFNLKTWPVNAARYNSSYRNLADKENTISWPKEGMILLQCKSC
jgi:hypothetical protein